MKTFIISENAALRDLVARTAREAGYAALVCDSADNALRVYEREKPILLLIEWGRSKAGGCNLCRRIRKSAGGDAAFIIALTQTDAPEQLRAALDGGADDYVAPPFTASVLALRLAVARGQALHRTACRRAKDQLLAFEEQAQQLAAQIQAVLWMCTADFEEFLYISPQCKAVWGRSFEEMRASPNGVVDFIHPEDRSPYPGPVDPDYRARAIETGSSEVECRIFWPDGQIRWLRHRTFPIRDHDGNIWRFGGITEDITDRKEVELALLASERRYRQLFEHSPIAIWEEDFSEVKAHIDSLRKEGVTDFRKHFSDHPEEAVACAYKVRIVEVNAASLKLYGARSNEQLRAGLPNLFTEDSYHAFIEQLEAMGEGRTFLEAESRTCSLTGEERNIAFIWSVAPGYESSYGRVLISIVDLTELKRAQKRARHSQAELARVARVNILGEMAGALAHQLSQPLAAISGYAEGCTQRMQLGRPVHAELVDAVQRIASEALRAGKIIHGVRNLLRRGELDYQTADLNTLVSEVSQLALVEADHEGFTLRFDLAPQLPAVRVDSLQIQQVILNLVHNGFDAMRKKASQAGEVTISTSAPEPGIVQITVSDQGAGFPVQNMEEIFEPFFTTKASGLGMGLAICRSIVEAHGGTLSASNAPSAGASVRITLPVHGDHEDAHD